MWRKISIPRNMIKIDDSDDCHRMNEEEVDNEEVKENDVDGREDKRW